MSTDSETPKWEPARLIPVSGIRSSEEQERRATSALLAVLSAVDEFGVAITKPLGAPKGRLKTYIEVPFKMQDGRCVRPDGIIEVSRGKKSWKALVEVKTGNNDLKREQTETYLDLAKEQGFDSLVTISNQIARIPGEHPVDVDKRKIKKIALHHLSWSRILTEAVLQKSHRGVADIDQAWILQELIRYLQHPKAGSVDFSDMGEHWVRVRDAVKHGTLRPTDNYALEIASKWEELVSFAALQLGRKLGADVQEVLSAAERSDIAVRIQTIVETMVSQGSLPAAIRIPNTVGDLCLMADLRAQQIVVSVTLDAPKQGRPATRINWLLRQLKSAHPNVRLESRAARAKSTMADLLSNVQKNPALLIPDGNREIVSFTVSLARPMGLKRATGKGAFIDSVLHTLDEFYGDVVQRLREWQPPAPKLRNQDASDRDDAEPELEENCEKKPSENIVNRIDNANGSNVESSVDSPSRTLDAIEESGNGEATSIEHS